MKYRRLGRTNLKVSVIGIGGGAFNNPEVSPDDVEKIMEEASKLGINFIETAEDYGEEKIGYALENIKTKFIISTKSLMRDEKRIEKSIENSLKKLNTDYIHIYQLHNVVSVDDLEERLRCVLPVLKEAQHEGIIGYIGITSDFVNPLMKAIETNEFDVVEAHYNVGNTLSERLFEGAKKRNIGVIVAKPLGGGLLIEREPENRKRKGSEVMNVDNALRFVLSNRNVSTALVGVKSLEHLRECASVTRNNFNISLQERKNIAKKMLGFLGKNFCRSCVNCMPCDINGWDFNIPEVLRLHGFYFIYGHKADLMNGYRKLNFKVDACNYCRRCEKRCPFNLPIAKMLKEVDIVFKKYEHFYFKKN
jgi:predicted aldo/keto reductase-like oxidoreductase